MPKPVKVWTHEGREVEIQSESEALKVLDDYRKSVESDGKKWEIKDGLGATHIDPSWFCDTFNLSVIRMFLFYKHSPHSAFEVPFSAQPAVWVDAVPILDGAFGVSL